MGDLPLPVTALERVDQAASEREVALASPALHPPEGEHVRLAARPVTVDECDVIRDAVHPGRLECRRLPDLLTGELERVSRGAAHLERRVGMENTLHQRRVARSSARQ